MSETDDSENHIWEYKSLGKKKRSQESASTTTTTVSKRRCTMRTTDNTTSTVKRTKPDTTARNGDGPSGLETQTAGPSHVNGTVQTRDPAEGSSSGDYCPICQMPFSVVVVQTLRWHVAECLDTPRDTCTECPDGLRCSSTIASHYSHFNHTLLAHSRANGESALLGPSQQPGPSGLTDRPGLIGHEEDVSVLQTSQDSVGSVSSVTGTPPSKRTNVLMCLRSPGPEDLKKKKGWSPTVKAHKSLTSSQGSKTELSSTPVKETRKGQTCLSKTEPPLENDEFISYSPLSELPSETEVNNNECRKNLFQSAENQDEDSPTLFSGSFSSEDELLSQFLDQMENKNGSEEAVPTSNVQVPPVTSSAPANQPTAQNRGEQEVGVKGDCRSSFQSPQRVVLERLRETILTSDNLSKDQSDPAPSQTSSLRRSDTMPPQRSQSKGGQASSLKQTDIGVFFGLKPLKEEKEAESGPSRTSAAPAPAFSENSRQRRPRRERQRKGRADGTGGTSEGAAPASAGDGAGGSQGGWKRGGGRGWRRRRATTNADGEVEYPRCPFYKKIPGTKFVIDAFHYGEIEGISAYFLTHFHSDHYGGLTKNSTLPIYCNSITGNLVKSKLKVEEQHVHILPMNTEVTVDGVKVILLEANHCPGAAMLLFSLPDGQTVLHTGDFRADPSMETYPELLSCRVQTLYLDTTYCSPEYTFPTQQDAINFAANTAFEQVTLNPRTLVVCGSYSVGKEKVFLALAEVLGSKVCLSRDKYNTMCCLESEAIRQRITTDWKAAQVHVLPMMQLTISKLTKHLARFSRHYDQLVAFKPTGWTFSQEAESAKDIQPQISGNIAIYGIPYSEHSSFLELKRFVQWLKPVKIIPTVNNGSWASRKAMEETFREWLIEARGKL